ncbi:filamentous hemagglutinin N-terminal domain-containing protein [Novosphingobium sp. PC22D]|uniref:beta strand repeat-containing protein n=1 Tax=Novosphingobium sp. PC22D TaxID=1962403 RepID=UPI00143C6853|nr:filamentous hemagglutinin N-terminal domain-containing protein [Novosphingobium sp. PC22D]
MRCSLIALATMLATAAPASAQTVITTDGSTATVVSAAGAVTTIDAGTVSGNNLFHSFAQFDLSTGDIAQWVRSAPDAASIAHVINRVTGGEPSDIDGTLRMADMPNADFWFVNPSGVLFGPGSAIEVPNAFTVSTAQALTFADGTVFSTTTPDGSTFSSAAPEAFGFLGGQGAIVAEGVDWSLGDAQLAAADVSVSGSVTAQFLTLRGIGEGAIDVAIDDGLAAGAIGSGTVALSSATIGAQIVKLRAGTILVDNTLVRVEAEGFSTIDAAAESFVMTSSVFDVSDFRTQGSLDQFSSIFVDAIDIDIFNSVLSSETGNAALPGLIALYAGNEARITSSSLISDATTFTGEQTGGQSEPGEGGGVLVSAQRIVLDSTEISANALGDGNAGFIFLDASDRLSLFNTSVRSDSFGTGDAGFISSFSGDVDLVDSVIGSDAFAEGPAGFVEILATGDVSLVNSTIGSSARVGSAGRAGNVEIAAAGLSLSDGSNISSDSAGEGMAGSVLINADSLAITGSDRGAGTYISSDALGDGDAGGVTINVAGALTLTGGAAGSTFITSGAVGQGNAGDVTINAGDIVITGSPDTFTFISSDSEGLGAGGRVRISADTLVLVGVERGDTSITSSAFGNGSGGGVEIDVNGLAIVGAPDSFTYISSDSDGAGDAGGVTITAGVMALIGAPDAGQTYVSSDSRGSGNGGNVSISAGTLEVVGAENAQTYISSDSLGTGSGGDVRLDVGLTRIASRAFVSSDALGPEGNAGTVTITGNGLLLDDRAVISTGTNGDGDAGDIAIDVGELTLAGGSAIRSTNTRNSSGRGGNIAIDGESLTLLSNSTITTDTSGTGDAGSVSIAVTDVALTDSRITSNTSGEGFAGSVQVFGQTLTLTALDIETYIGSDAFGPGGAGFIGIDMGEIELTGNANVLAFISSDSLGGGDAGIVTVFAQRLALEQAAISAEVRFDEGDGSSVGGVGFITIQADEIVLDRSAIVTNTAYLQDAGAINVLAGSIEMFGSRISSDTFDVGNGGVVTISADTLSLAGGSVISSDTLAAGNAGALFIAANTIELVDSFVTSDTFTQGDAGFILMGDPNFDEDAGNTLVLTLDNSVISTSARSSGDSGFISILGQTVTLDNGSVIETSTFGSGDAGFVQIVATDFAMDRGASISSSALSRSTGAPGFVYVVADSIRLNGDVTGTVPDDVPVDSRTRITSTSIDRFVPPDPDAEFDFPSGLVFLQGGSIYLGPGALIDTSSLGAAPAGLVSVTADDVVLNNAQIGSTARGSGPGGQLLFQIGNLTLENASEISTNSFFSTAGNIGIFLPPDGKLIVRGDDPSTITTSAITGNESGGTIQIEAPFLVLSDGGRILALGQVDSADVSIISDYYIRSADRINELSVDGSLFVDSQIRDLSAGIETPSADFLDAASVLSGQCAAARSTGATSRFTSRVTGPYALPRIDAPDPVPPEPDGTPPLSLVALGRTCG